VIDYTNYALKSIENQEFFVVQLFGLKNIRGFIYGFYHDKATDITKISRWSLCDYPRSAGTIPPMPSSQHSALPALSRRRPTSRST
jgi:hypothetical protein